MHDFALWANGAIAGLAAGVMLDRLLIHPLIDWSNRVRRRNGRS